jgi:Gnt-I system high-affinity gluconate transporter/Gnt-II system L-idonate transporter
MPLIILGVSILVLLFLIGRVKLNAFLALVIVSFLTGVANGLSAEAALKSILKGIGDTMGALVLVIVFGAILGKLIEESGAAHTISYWLTDLIGEKRIQISVLITGFLVGLPMVYNASFLVLIPLIYTLSATSGLPLLYLGIPLSSSLSVTHGYLPPHPAPTAVAMIFKADVNMTLLYGMIVAVPASILAGPGLAYFCRNMRNEPPPGLYGKHEFRREDLPGIGVSLFTTLIPVLLMLAGAIVALTLPKESPAAGVMRFVSDPTIALLAAVLVGFYTLGLKRGRDMEKLMSSVVSASSSVAMILLIIASGGAFKQVLLDCGTGNAIQSEVHALRLSPIVLAWGTAAMLRLTVGSATVAAITAAGIVSPLVPNSGALPELVALATGAGSLMFSHFNDIGFWMFKEYYNATVKQTFQVWSVMECIVGVVGLLGVLALSVFFKAAI